MTKVTEEDSANGWARIHTEDSTHSDFIRVDPCRSVAKKALQMRVTHKTGTLSGAAPQVDAGFAVCMKRDFATLTAQEALHVAIFIEERNAEIYRQFAELFQHFGGPDAQQIAGVFEEMCEEEIAHGTELQERYRERYGTHACSITDDEVEDIVELPRVPDGAIFAIARTGATLVPRRQALAIALKAEKAARHFYAFLAKITDDEKLAALYYELGAFEDDHVSAVEHQLNLIRSAGAGEA